MFPLLFSLGPVKFYTSTLFLIIAFFSSTYVFWKMGREEHYSQDELLDGYFIALVWGLIWSRIGYIGFHFPDFGMQPLAWIDIFTHGGFTPVVGIFAAGASLYRFAQRQKWDAYEILDFGSVALSLVITILWLGNFFSGAELGTPTQLPLGIQFPNLFDRRHPVQLYGFVIYLLLFIYLFWVESRYRTFEWYKAKKDSAQTGFLFAMFCIISGIGGFLIWIFTAAKIYFFSVPVEPVIRLFLVLYGSFVLFRRSGRTLSFKKGHR